MSKYDTVIGLEVHIQLNTNTKAFCGDALSFGDDPNTHVSAISLAHPGTLPVVNSQQIDKAIRLGVALGCHINEFHFFDRKHYFYPDLPKGYQITQDKEPICIGGSLEIDVNGQKKKVRIHHIHMEEDAGKTIHDIDDQYSLVDLNRAGTPLLELVTEPDLSSGDEVYAFVSELQKLVRYIDVSDADMEKGSMRCDCNVSVKPAGSPVLGERCEIKNLNSKRFAREAVEYEAKRQIKMVEAGISFTKQTLHYNVDEKVTQTLRDKEGAEDYRYFPDPDLAPMQVSDTYLQSIIAAMPDLPWKVRKKLVEELGLVEDHADQITADPFLVKVFYQLNHAVEDPKSVSAFMTNLVIPQITAETIDSDALPCSIDQMIVYLKLLGSGDVTISVANQTLWPLICSASVSDIRQKAKDLGIIINKNEDFLTAIIDEVLSENPDELKKFKGGKKNLMGFFVGQVMRKAKGSADPKSVQKALSQALQR